MAIVAGRVLADNKHIWVALTGIFGVGKSRALQICKTVGIQSESKVKELNESQLDKVREALATFTIEGDLRRELTTFKKSLQMMGSYRGVRSRRGLPCRGQRTRTNARTAKRLRRRA